MFGSVVCGCWGRVLHAYVCKIIPYCCFLSSTTFRTIYLGFWITSTILAGKKGNCPKSLTPIIHLEPQNNVRPYITRCCLFKFYFVFLTSLCHVPGIFMFQCIYNKINVFQHCYKGVYVHSKWELIGIFIIIFSSCIYFFCFVYIRISIEISRKTKPYIH